MAHHVIYTGHLSYTAYSGDVHVAEIAARVRCGQARADFAERRCGIHDFTRATSLRLEARTVQGLAASDCGAAVTNPRLKIAVIGTLPAVAELVDAYRAVPVPAFELRHFATLAQASAWLRVQLPSASKVGDFV